MLTQLNVHVYLLLQLDKNKQRLRPNTPVSTVTEESEQQPPPLSSLLPKKTTPPLSHVFNPLSQAFQEMDDVQQDFARQQAERAQPKSLIKGKGRTSSMFSMKTWLLALCKGNLPVNGGFPSQNDQ